MKQCPKCNTLIGENASKCFNCNYEDNSQITIKPPKFVCSKCSVALEHSYDICECGGNATTIDSPEHISNKNISDNIEEDSSIGFMGWFLCIIFSFITFIVCMILYVIIPDQQVKLAKMIILSALFGILLVFIKLIIYTL